jgi:hypothetical protein
MAVKSIITHKLDIPHESGEWFEFRELGWRTLELARETKARASLLGFRDLGPEFLKSLTTTEDAPEGKEAEPSPKDTYDMSVLLRASIASWSYGVPCSEDNIDNLDQATATWAFDSIIKIHFPTEEEVGKVSKPSKER